MVKGIILLTCTIFIATMPQRHIKGYNDIKETIDFNICICYHLYNTRHIINLYTYCIFYEHNKPFCGLLFHISRLSTLIGLCAVTQCTFYFRI